MPATKSLLNAVHGTLVFGRRVRILADRLARCIPKNVRVLDVGTGDGSIVAEIAIQRPDVVFQGIDVLLRPLTHIPVSLFDGYRIPFEDNSFEVVSFIDVLHHTQDPSTLLREAARVARRYVLIKDHLREGAFAAKTLRIMDWVGNFGHNVVLPYNYLSEAEWRRLFADARLVIEHWDDKLNLYPTPFSILFDRRLHVITQLAVMPPVNGISISDPSAAGGIERHISRSRLEH